MEHILFQISIWVLPAVLAITLHEAAHGWVAHKLGDPTAYLMGRVTFNPLKHVDPFGTLMLPAGLLLLSGGSMAFGWAKPVPVNVRDLPNPRRAMALIAAAGPVSNLLMALAAAILLHTLQYMPEVLQMWLFYNLGNAVVVNLVLFCFNLIPLPPLDGGRIAVGLLPGPLAYRLARVERYGLPILLTLLFVVPWVADKLGTRFVPFDYLMAGPVSAVWRLIAWMTGLG